MSWHVDFMYVYMVLMKLALSVFAAVSCARQTSCWAGCATAGHMAGMTSKVMNSMNVQSAYMWHLYQD